MKKLMNKKGNKQGVILVIVLFILAMAMIFISAALMLTNATRSRVYKNAESDQARLTVTAAAEAFYRALEIQEIQDAQLQKLANANSTLNMSYTGSTIPGLTEDANNKTTVHIYHPAGVSSRYVYCDFQTIIDEQTENARIVLFEKDPPDPKGLFVNQLDYNGNQGNNFRGIIGGDAPAGVKDNTILFRGDYRTNQSEYINFTSDVYFIGKADGSRTDVKFESSEIYSGDLYFLDNVYMNWSKSTDPKFKGNMYFIGKSGSDGAFSSGDSGSGTTGGSESRSYSKNGTVWTFMNRSVNVGTNSGNGMGALKDSKTTLFVDGSGDWKVSLADDLKNDGSYSTNMTKWKNSLSSYDSIIAKAEKAKTAKKTAGDYPTTGDLKTDSNLPTSKAELDGTYKTTTFQSLISDPSSPTMVPSGNYLIDGDTSIVKHIKEGDAPQVIFLNGQSDYIFFINGNVTMEGLIFVTVNPSSKHSTYFLLAKGKTIRISDDQSRTAVSSGSSAKLATGFLSMNYGSDLSAVYSKVKSMTLADCNKTHNGKSIPTTYIYGLGSNQMTIYGGTCIEAYVGMFDSSYPSSSNITTTNFGTDIDSYGNPRYFSFYGRIMAQNINNTSGNFKMPYCPQPNADDGSDEEIESLYKVVDFLYYY